MNFHVMTLFPDMIAGVTGESIIGRAVKSGCININVVNIRDFAMNRHSRVDDYPYGGGAGMVMQAEPIYLCYEHIRSEIICSRADGVKDDVSIRTIYLTPQGRTFDQRLAYELSMEKDIVLLCGHYEGVDERVIEEIDAERVSIGDYVLTGGEIPALAVMDAVSRLVPGVLNNVESAQKESFSAGLLEHPQYTRPEHWRGRSVPPVLLSGNHKKLEEWYRTQSVIRTAALRPDLLCMADLTEEEKRLAQEKKEEFCS